MTNKQNKNWKFKIESYWNLLGFNLTVLDIYWGKILREITILNFSFSWEKKL